MEALTPCPDTKASYTYLHDVFLEWGGACQGASLFKILAALVHARTPAKVLGSRAERIDHAHTAPLGRKITCSSKNLGQIPLRITVAGLVPQQPS